MKGHTTGEICESCVPFARWKKSEFQICEEELPGMRQYTKIEIDTKQLRGNKSAGWAGRLLFYD